MSLTESDLSWLTECAGEAARLASEHIARSRPTTVHHKEAGTSLASQVVTDVDREAEAIVLATLAPSVARYDLGVVSEERPDTGERHRKNYFWSIDPLDGTLPFIEGQPGFAVSIALVARDGRPLVGVVVDPADKVTYRAAIGQGATRNGRAFSVATQTKDTLTVFFDRSFEESSSSHRVLDRLRTIASDRGLEGIEVRSGAGAVMNACHSLESSPACYFKLPKPVGGGGSIWDFAATACLFAEAGALVSDIHGHPLDLNRTHSTFMNHRGVLFATDEELAGHIRALYRGIEADGIMPA